MTEADLQNAAYAVLETILPTFQKSEIKCQVSFTIKFGHHNVTIDGKEPAKNGNRGIYDLLIYVNEEPLILLELKKKGLVINAEDIKQGISYARLTDKITPITIISNGTDTRIHNTITKEPIEDRELTNEFLSKIKTGLQLASEDYKESLEVITKGDQRVLFNVINNITREAFERLTGEIEEFEKPIVEVFNVPRDIKEKFDYELKSNNFLLLYGDAFTGKTTFLSQYFKSEIQAGNAFLYNNAKETFYSIFKKLSTYLTGTLGYYISEEKVREWLLSNFLKESNLKLTIIFDNLRLDNNHEIFEHIYELKDIFGFTDQRIILCADTTALESLIREKDRLQDSIIGSEFARIKLDNFSTKEYHASNKIMQNNFNLSILEGGVYAKEYHTPRIWRILLHEMLKRRPEEHAKGFIESLPNLTTVKFFKNILQLNSQNASDFKEFVKVFVEIIPNIKGSTEFVLMTYNLGCIDEETAKKHLDEELLKRLVISGFVERRPMSNLKFIFIPKLPELVAGFAVKIIKEKFLPLFRDNLDDAYVLFKKTCVHFPYGELVAAKVIYQIGKKNEVDVFSTLINRLWEDEPRIEVSTGEKKIALYIEGLQGIKKFKSVDGEEDRFYINLFPYLILSHLTYINIGDGTDNPHQIRFDIIKKIGSYKFTIRRVDQGFFHEGIESYGSDVIGDFVASNMGIVEPIVLGLKSNLLLYPELSKTLFEEAIKQKIFTLLHRFYIAARNSLGFGNETTNELCEYIINTYETETKYQLFAYASLGFDASRQMIRNRIRELKKIIK